LLKLVVKFYKRHYKLLDCYSQVEDRVFCIRTWLSLLTFAQIKSTQVWVLFICAYCYSSGDGLLSPELTAPARWRGCS